MEAKVVTTRIPHEHFKELVEIEREEQADRAEVVRRLLARGIRDWKVERALKLLRVRKITLRRAARMAGVSYAEMLDLASDDDIGYSLEELARDLQRHG